MCLVEQHNTSSPSCLLCHHLPARRFQGSYSVAKEMDLKREQMHEAEGFECGQTVFYSGTCHGLP